MFAFTYLVEYVSGHKWLYINNTPVYQDTENIRYIVEWDELCAVRLKPLMINACSALRRTTKNNTAFSTLSSLSTQPIKHCLHWKTNGRWERGRWGEREDVVWLGQLGSLEGHSCVLQLLCWTIFSADHLIWSNGGDRGRWQREKDSRCTTATEALQKIGTWPKMTGPARDLYCHGKQQRATSTDCRNSPSLQGRAATCGPVLFMTMTNIFPSNYSVAQ